MNTISQIIRNVSKLGRVMVKPVCVARGTHPTGFLYSIPNKELGSANSVSLLDFLQIVKGLISHISHGAGGGISFIWLR